MLPRQIIEAVQSNNGWNRCPVYPHGFYRLVEHWQPDLVLPALDLKQPALAVFVRDDIGPMVACLPDQPHAIVAFEQQQAAHDSFKRLP